MKPTFAVLAISALVASAAFSSAPEYGGADFFALDRWFCGAAGSLALPQGGAEPRRAGGGAVRAGYYLNEFWALEAEGSLLENQQVLGGDVLWHWWGYERLDPFFTFGARCWIGADSGPSGGLGTFYHLDDHWSLRFDVHSTLGVESGASMIYQFSFGVQRSW